MQYNASKQVFHSKAFKEGLGILKDEIQLAFQWGRPSILLAVHNSKLGQIKAQQTLEKELIKTNKKVEWIQADGKTPDVIGIMCKISNRDEIVIFVSGIGNTEGLISGDVHRALNLHRELLVEQHIRVVFWLTESEAANLPHQAPDFWAFRHRVVEFASRRGTKKAALPAGLLLWKDQVPLTDPEKLKDTITHHEEILAHLPPEENVLTTRLETLLALAHYNWLVNDSHKFSSYLANVLDLSEKYSHPHFQAWAFNAKGIKLYEAGEKVEASLLFKKSLNHEPYNSIFMINSSITLHALGRSRDAILSGRKAIKQDVNNPRLWCVLGYLYLSMGKLEDSIEAIKKAQELEPYNIDTHYSLAICYYKDGQSDACAEEIRTMREILPEHDPFQRACIGIMTGKINEAYLQLKQSLEKGEITKQQIMRDPNLQILMDPHERMSIN